jgi:hypothetical protein
VVLVYSCQRSTELPHAAGILPPLLEEPVQEPTNERPFEFEHFGKHFSVYPVAEYTLRGIIVSHNDISAFSDIYHTKKSVDFRDICVLWGGNLTDDSFRTYTYWSEPWSCHMRGGAKGFHLNAISNNHLLSDRAEVRNAIKEAQIGDQIELRGMLVNYHPTGASENVRRSSTTREDTGNGACEVVFVEEFNLLKRANSEWRRAYGLSLRLLVFALILKCALFLWVTYTQVRL